MESTACPVIADTPLCVKYNGSVMNVIQSVLLDVYLFIYWKTKMCSDSLITFTHIYGR